MKKFTVLLLAGSALALGACSAHSGADYNYETKAPYSESRTAKSKEVYKPVQVKEVKKYVAKKADKVFMEAQRK